VIDNHFLNYFQMGLSANFETWLRPEPSGLYCEPGDFYIDPLLPVERAVVTHGHSDHARPGHQAVLATRETRDIMKIRLGEDAGRLFQALKYFESIRLGEVDVSLVPAGHILGSAQVVIEYRGQRAVVSGDYKRQRDPTCPSFEPVKCDLFITEATFGLPVFKFDAPGNEIRKLLASMQAFPDQTHQIGVYGLGKCQRVIALLREAGYERPIWLHGALKSTTDYYSACGMQFGDLRLVADSTEILKGDIVLCPPSALGDRWSRRFTEPIHALASGWMRVRGRARQRGVELPLVISDHADWPNLLATVADTEAGEVWITHGREEALVYELTRLNLKAKALSLIGLEEEIE
jgi:putative mRNA 3-end processing factor